ncbi:MAG: hypothetical protein IIC13_08595 [SAR324 cluster bacterium]|nr:hypothetical protein [SAR324 cluster bacterium]
MRKSAESQLFPRPPVTDFLPAVSVGLAGGVDLVHPGYFRRLETRRGPERGDDRIHGPEVEGNAGGGARFAGPAWMPCFPWPMADRWADRHPARTVGQAAGLSQHALFRVARIV